jgi:C2H2 transcription facotor
MATISSLVSADIHPVSRSTEQLDSPTTPRQASYGPGPAIENEPDHSNHTHRSTVAEPGHVPSVHHDQQPATSISTPFVKRLARKAEDDLDADDDDDDGEEKAHAMDVDASDHDLDGSDNEGDQGDGDGSKKKKGQRFFCSGYPPCNLSFTRSEHLARHIRKHTGERPFQCHCNRRFSRLDNLRQHAQTVHVNEEIPGDSLAATGTRFQRQIRTDRVRPTGRPRTGTMGSNGGHSRGHSRNLSTSSVGSTSSNYSTIGEAKRRPPPLLMANDSSTRPKLGIETPTTPPQVYRAFHTDSPTTLTTPTSATFSALTGSPAYGSSIGSPASSVPHMGGVFNSGTPARRLSVPSGQNSQQPPYPGAYPPPQSHHMGPPHGNQSSSGTYASPTTAGFSYIPNSYQVQSGEDWRRRTWHSSNFSGGGHHYTRPATSSLTYSRTPDAPQPAKLLEQFVGDALEEREVLVGPYQVVALELVGSLLHCGSRSVHAVPMIVMCYEVLYCHQSQDTDSVGDLANVGVHHGSRNGCQYSRCESDHDEEDQSALG